MTKHRFYIQREADKPEFDLWVEIGNQFAAVPEIRMCYNGEQGKEIVINLTTMTAIRLNAALKELIELASKPFEDYVAEREIDD